MVLYIKELGTDSIESALITIHQNYCAQLCKLNDKEIKNIKILAVGAGLSGRFDHTSKLK